MGKYLVELYVPRGQAAAVERGVELTRRAAAQLTLAGTPVRHLRSIFVPEDETCFFLYEADDPAVVERAAEAAGLQFERVATAFAELSS